jgi:putative ABC transport system permease protein
MKNLPTNTVLKRSVIASYASMARINRDETEKWGAWGMTTTFVVLRPRSDMKSVETKVEALMKSRLDPKESTGYSCYLQSLPNIYLDSARSGISNDLTSSGNLTQIYVFSAIAFLILLVAAINFINLSTAKIARRLKEVAVRKTFGAERRDLVRQFLTESILVTAAAMALGLIFFSIFKPQLDAYLGKELSFNLFSGIGLPLLPIGLILIVGLLAGSYPAFFLSRFPAAVILRPGAGSHVSKSGLRRALVICQFFIAVVMIASTLVVLKQIRYSSTMDLGFNVKNLVLLQVPDARRLKITNVLKNEIMSRAQIPAAAITFLPSAQNRGLSVFRLENSPQAKGFQAQTLSFDPDFIATFGLKVVAGRNFAPGRTSENEGILINERAARDFGFADPVGQVIYRNDKPQQIIGVVRDWHTNSIHSLIEPVVMTVSGETAGNLVVRIPAENRAVALDRIREIWNRLLPGQTFDPSPVDEFLNKAYVKEKRLGSILVSFCLLTVFVACLGVFGLASFIAEQRTKEIGIRKVLGAGVSSITGLLSKKFVGWILAASVPAFPVAYLIINKWLSGFAYRTNVGAGPFLLSGFIALTVALASIIIQTVKAATADPIKSIRYE